MSSVSLLVFCRFLLTCSYFLSFVLFSICRQYSDLAEDERAAVLEKFRQMTIRWNQISHAAGEGNEDEVEKHDKSHMIIVTDACLPLLASGEAPLNAHLLINYELPPKKVLPFVLYCDFSYLFFLVSHIIFPSSLACEEDPLSTNQLQNSKNCVLADVPLFLLFLRCTSWHL